MKLNLNDLNKITYGVDRIVEEDGFIYFHRFSEEQVKYYDNKNAIWGLKARSTSGIKLRFKTNSKYFKLKINADEYNGVRYFSFDVYVNGKYLSSLTNYEQGSLPEMYYYTEPCPIGDFEKTFDLGDGEKTVFVYFPWNAVIKFYSIELSDGAYFEPVPYSGKALIYGDSISQGYYVQTQKKRYISQLTEWLDLEEVSKAIGGEKFCPEVLDLKETCNPDLVIVSYGSNDWYFKTRNEFYKDADEFLNILSAKYNNRKIIVLGPIWRADLNEPREFGDFNDVGLVLGEICAKYKNLNYINARRFVPELPEYFGDGYLHPNDKGSDKYFESLKQEVEKIL
ncbi:MAG: SGNH/GDSL hydrolase family protein [Clostridia bacterium]|nr:SGNH/GDSL hydrolase family protein [Clostridia bacterium]